MTLSLCNLSNSACELFHLDCGNTTTIDNGQVYFSGVQTTYGQTVPVTCNTGYKLTGGTSIECLHDGSWSTSTTCEMIGLYFHMLLCIIKLEMKNLSTVCSFLSVEKVFICLIYVHEKLII